MIPSKKVTCSCSTITKLCVVVVVVVVVVKSYEVEVHRDISGTKIRWTRISRMYDI